MAPPKNSKGLPRAVRAQAVQFRRTISSPWELGLQVGSVEQPNTQVVFDVDGQVVTPEPFTLIPTQTQVITVGKVRVDDGEVVSRR